MTPVSSPPEMSTVGVCGGGGGGRGGSGGGEGWLCGRTWRSYKVHKNVAAQLLIADRGVCVAGPSQQMGYWRRHQGVGWGGRGEERRRGEPPAALAR